MTTGTWNAVIDENTCDECRALHGKPISEIGMIPPLHGTHDPQGRMPCRCTIRTEANERTTRKRMEEIAAEHGLSADEARLAIDGLFKLVAKQNGGK